MTFTGVKKEMTEEEIEDAAARWLAREMSGSMTAQEEREFKAWLAKDCRHRDAYRMMRHASEAVFGADEALLTDVFEAELHALAKEKARSSAVRIASIAASFVAVVIAGAVAVSLISSPQPQTYLTERGERQRIALIDGSAIELNSATEINVAYARRRRIAEVRAGEAFFNVSRNLERPFFVRTTHGEVKVTGTSFGVRLDGDATIVSVVSGAVEVSSDAQRLVTLLAGQEFRLSAAGSGAGIISFDPNMAFAWKNGKARFRNTPLAEVTEALNTYFDRPIVLADDALGALPVTGEFDIDDQSTAIAALSVVFALDVEEETDRIVLRKKADQ